MATKAQIEMNFKQAIAQADKLDEQANNLKRLARNKLNGTLQTIAGNWKGMNAEQYLKKGQTLEDSIASTASELADVAGQIRTIARRMYEAEMAALTIAQNRTY